MSYSTMPLGELSAELLTYLFELREGLNDQESEIGAAYENEKAARREMIHKQAARDNYEARRVVELRKTYEASGQKVPSMDNLKAEARADDARYWTEAAQAEADYEVAKMDRMLVQGREDRLGQHVRALRAGALVLASRTAGQSAVTGHELHDELFEGLEHR